MASVGGSFSKRDLTEELLTKPYPLSNEQKEAVINKARHARIVAGAGAGKTETLTRRIVYLLLAEDCRPSDIVAFTFTEKAARGMKDRLYQRIDKIAGPGATTKLGEMFIGTMHAFAKRVLDDHFGFGSYDVLDENQEVAYLMRHGWALNLKEFGSNYAEGCLTFRKTAGMVWDEMLDREQVKRKAKIFSEALEAYERTLQKDRRLTFGQMMAYVVAKLADKPEVLSSIKHLIVDEYQDINRAQARLIEIIGKSAGVFVVGDPRQSIYQWRGSDERFFKEFLSNFTGALPLSLKENRRSGNVLVNSANRVAENIGGGTYPSMDPFRKDKGHLIVYRGTNPDAEAEWVTDQIVKLMKNNGLKYSDIAVLMRSVATSAPPFLDRFRRRRIPCVVGGKVGLFRKPEAQALGRIFAWFWNDGFWVVDPWRWNEQVSGDDLLTSAFDLWEEATGKKPAKNVEPELRKIKAAFNNDKSSFQNLTEIYHEILIQLEFMRLSHHDPNDLTIMASLGRFGQILTDYETANRLGGRTPKWNQDLKNLCWFMNTYATQSYEDRTPEEAGGVPAVQLMTVHQAKGLEWPVVFIVTLVKRRFPSTMVGHQQEWCGVPRDMFDVVRYEGSIDDERRLFYVAHTRAKDLLVLSLFEWMRKATAPSPFLDEITSDKADHLEGDQQLPRVSVQPQESPEEMVTFNAGEVIHYKNCPYGYLLGAVLGFQPGLHFGLGYGKSLHFCLRRGAELMKNEGYNPVSAVATAVDEDFHMPFAGGKVLVDFKESARTDLVAFARKYEEDFKRIQEVEYRIEFPVPGATITGKVDVILRDQGAVEVWDYKTREDKRDMDELGWQVQLYSLGLKKLGRKVSGSSIAFISEAKVKPVPIDEGAILNVATETERHVRSICIMEFNAASDKAKCERCDFGAICRWRKSA